MPASNKEYVGDSVYATTTGYSIVLTTENGKPSDPSNTIEIDGHDIPKLLRFIMRSIPENKRQDVLIQCMV